MVLYIFGNPRMRAKTWQFVYKFVLHAHMPRRAHNYNHLIFGHPVAEQGLEGVFHTKVWSSIAQLKLNKKISNFQDFLICPRTTMFHQHLPLQCMHRHTKCTFLRRCIFFLNCLQHLLKNMHFHACACTWVVALDCTWQASNISISPESLKSFH